MLRWLIQTAIHQRVLVLGAAVLLLFAGIRAAQTIPLDVFPEFARPLVEIQTEAPGLSTEEVEALVTLPLESALAGISGLETLRSNSVLGLSSVVLFFRQGSDLMAARQRVQERLSVEASRLPAVVRAPVMLAPLSSTSRAMKISVSSKVLSQMELSELVRWTIRPRLGAVPGVANIAVWGQRDRQLQVQVDPNQLRMHGVTLDAVLRSVADAVPLAPGGFLDTPSQRLAVRQVTPFLDVGSLAAAVVDGAAPLTLGNVARVVEGHAPPIGDAVINGGSGLLLIVEKQPSSNTLTLTRDVEAALDALRPALAGVDVDSTIFRPASFIQLSLNNLQRALWFGAALVILILMIFLRDWRTAVISVAAIPLSLVAALVMLWLQGGTLNTLFLAGLVIALGEVVDDAIIDVENIQRRLKLAVGTGQPAWEVVLAASVEVRSAVVYASLIVSLVFLPVFFMDGLAGVFFGPLAQAYVLSIMASLLVALTVTPALSLWLLPSTLATPRRQAPWMARVQQAYRGLLVLLLARVRTVVVVVILAPLAALATTPWLGDAFLPDFKESDFLMHWIEKPGASVEASKRSTLRVAKELMAVPGVRNFGSHIGRAEAADEVVGPNFTEHWISLDPSADHDATVARVKAVVEGYPGVFRDVLTYLKERIKDVLSGGGGAIVVRIFGPDMAVLRESAGAVARVMGEIPGVTDLKVEQQVLVPQVEVRVRPERAALWGLSAARVQRFVATMLNGVKAGQVSTGQQLADVVVWSVPEMRTDVSGLRELRMELPQGGFVALGDVADVQVVPAPNAIKREAGSRRMDVSCNIGSGDLGAVAREVEARVGALSFARGYHPEFLGEYAARQTARRQMAWLSLLAFLGIIALLRADFGSGRLAFLMVATLPFALLGGVVATWLGGGVVSLGSLVGFVSVLGIAARNGIMIISHFKHLRAHEGAAFNDALVLTGAQERLVPVLMTALCAGLALVPIVLGGNVPGYEIEHPMAVVILGGLVSSTILNLLLVPVLYRVFAEHT